MDRTTPSRSTPGRSLRVLGLAVVALAVVNVARSAFVPGRFHLPLNLTIAVVAVVISWAAGLDLGDLGLRRERLRSGLAFGLGAMGIVLAASVIGAVAASWISAVSETSAEATEGTSLGDLLVQVLVLIPLGTVVVEEFVFRGALLGSLLRGTSTARAVAVSSLVFGLWHVYPAFGNLDDGRSAVALGAAVAGTFVATTVAGLVFAWLRVRSESLAAPMLAHLATNTIPLTVAWSVS